MTRLLEVRDLTTEFRIDNHTIHAVNNVTYYVDEGEIISLVGESGCGKSASQLSVLQLIPTPPGKITRGEVLFEGIDLLKFRSGSQEMRAIRGGKIGMVFQEPMTSLNPVLTIGQQITESLILHLRLDTAHARARAIELLTLVGISDADERIDQYPHQFSGGMRQRVIIAMALCCNPKLLIADEATTALDVTTQAQLLEILRETVKRFNTSLLIVTHNLGVVARYAERIYVMYAGQIIESGTAKEVFGDPRHPYTVGLLKSVPRLDEPKGRRLVPIHGMPPSLTVEIAICPFLPRCSRKTEKCRHAKSPELGLIEDQHYVACHETCSRYEAKEIRIDRKEIAETNPLSASQPPENGNEHHGTSDVLLQVNQLKMYFPMTRGLLRRKVGDIKAVDDVSFALKKGETLGLVGESGCGKTTVARSILRLYSPTSGDIFFEGHNIAPLAKRQVRPFRRKMQLIFQDPYSSLNPRQTAGDIVGEPLIIHHLAKGKREHRDRVAELFRMVGLNPSLADRVPHEFSGGQRQRIGIARALASEPSFVVCDEPISALDVSIQAQIVNLLDELQDRLGLTYLFIGHDLSVVRHISDRVAVMYLGRIVEITDCGKLYANPLHPYTRALLSAVPIPDPFVEETRGELILLQGEVPSLVSPPAGCTFHPRCPLSVAECSHVVPALREIEVGHQVACLRA